jgi:hypothetical protein
MCSTLTTFTFTSFFYPPPLVSILTWPVFHSCSSLFRCPFINQRDFCLGFIPVHALCLRQCKPPPLHFLTLFPYPVLFNSFQHVSLCLLPYTDVFNYLLAFLNKGTHASTPLNQSHHCFLHDNFPSLLINIAAFPHHAWILSTQELRSLLTRVSRDYPSNNRKTPGLTFDETPSSFV